MYIYSIVKGLYAILTKKQKARMFYLQIFFIFSAMIQVAGIASIAPFIAIVSNPESIQTNLIFSHLYNIGGFNTDQDFTIAFAALSILLILVSNGTNALTLWIQIKFSIHIGSALQKKIYTSYIHSNYLFHKTNNYNKLIATILSETPRFVYMVLQPYLLLCSQVFIALAIVAGLIFIDPTIALGSAALVGFAYIFTYTSIKSRLKKHGKAISDLNKAIQSHLSESFIGIKDIKLNSLEHKYIERYYSYNKQALNSIAYISLAGDLPRFVIETISFSAILIFAVLLILNNSDNSSVVGILSIYALAGYRLLPTMQQIYRCISNISANGSVVSDIRNELLVDVHQTIHNSSEPIKEVNVVEVSEVTYQYLGSNRTTLEDISLSFHKGDLNTIAGPSGSGKSTLADIVLSLLEPNSGEIRVNGNVITNLNRSSYQRTIGYVPQQIFILDDSVIANVAFGLEPEEVDLDQVVSALTQADAFDFVQQLPQQLNTILGQDGKMLSGGQRQRIGIARALYRNTKVLVLDEPTSALDIESEHDLMLLLNSLKSKVLIIVISHRPAAIKLSDRITLVSEGKIIASDSYNNIFSSSEYFRSLIEKGFIS